MKQKIDDRDLKTKKNQWRIFLSSSVGYVGIFLLYKYQFDVRRTSKYNYLYLYNFCVYLYKYNYQLAVDAQLVCTILYRSRYLYMYSEYL